MPITSATKTNISSAYCQRSLKIMLARPALKGIRMPRGPPVNESKWLAITNATSLKASVAMAKKGPRSRNVGQEINTATAAANSAAGSIVSQGERPKST